tara:strand:+ start:285 stop:1190 length:906 start_codon:yes stop_codon:yes gene_type:complete
MATTTFTPLMLRGAGTRGIPEIPKNGGGGSYSYLLDDYGDDAYLAWSLRKLRSTYTGSAIRVRRDSDDAELDIGFVDNYLDTGSLYTFLSGSGDYGRLHTWYDQSGGTIRNSINSGASSLFVSATNDDFYSSGSILYLNETYKQYAATARLMDIPAETSHTVFVTNYAHAASQYYVILAEHTAGKEIIETVSDVITLETGSNAPFGSVGHISGSATHTQDALNTITAIVNEAPGETALYFEGNKIASGSGTTIPLMGSTFYPDKAQSNNAANPVELIMYLADKTSDRAAIDTNINDYYKTY